jgi:hypothetical protein
MQDRAPLVCAVVLNWNGRDDTVACLHSLSHLDYPALHIILVDNGSTDGTLKAVEERFPDVTTIANRENMGFAAGCNVGIRYSLSKGADYVFLVNNDTFFDPLALHYLVSVASPKVGMLAPKIYYANSPNRIWSIGGRRHPLTMEKVGDARGVVDDGRWNSPLERDYLTGCALLVSRQLFQEVGLFDERFFMYYEDSDFSLRARSAGFDLLLVPLAKVWHKVSSSSGGRDSPNERYWMAYSSVLFYYKHVKGAQWLIVFPYRLGSLLKTFVKLVLSNRKKSAIMYLKGLRDGFVTVFEYHEDEVG